MSADSALNAAALRARVLQLTAALRDAETRLNALAVGTRSQMKDSVIDLVAIEAEEAAAPMLVPRPRAAEPPQELGVEASPTAHASEDRDLVSATSGLMETDVHTAALSAVVPKSRFQAHGPTPDRIEALRDELST
jgi:hypothetical protein